MFLYLPNQKNYSLLADDPDDDDDGVEDVEDEDNDVDDDDDDDDGIPDEGNIEKHRSDNGKQIVFL